MKRLDKYILKSFLIPFLATFFIILFVLVMQALWLAFDDLAGKGISITIILKFLWYTTLIVAPQALPIGILLSSIMTLGSLSENYEFAATKSAGVSLQRMVRPLVFFAVFMSAINFVFLDYVYPYAIMKQINLKINIKKKQPALALVPGSFNTEIPNYQIKFDEKYGEDDKLLKNVLIYDLSANRGNNKIISAKNGEFLSEEGSKYLTLRLKNGHFFEHHVKNRTAYKERFKMKASYADFDEYTINIDISSFSDDDMDKTKHKNNFNMLSSKQLKDTLPKLKINYDEYVATRARSLYLNTNANRLYAYPDSLKIEGLKEDILENFDLDSKLEIANNAMSKIDRTINNFTANKGSFKHQRKIMNLYDIEFYNRFAFSLSCLLLFFIGAPLGSIIRKGGMGLPMILAIAIYVSYFFSNTFGRNMAEESSISAVAGSWLAVALMLPLAIILTTRATQDKGLFDINGVFVKIGNFFKKVILKKREN
ncbi:LptF/LptG family permease [Tenacibaculum jejuense]|uniref:Putative permease YjgP/YjgQ family n=1 Tax=Tenacibaculum jejuense TaxID=584609 RepID=A0A238U918_9FLAO|nr:LptF/LptG family permease [Tenacibaculum jejuense]SNR15496.1 putative permease YjgP/YjgQ family [Tenacibaculum jejuense]